MIVRILNEGQWTVTDDIITELNVVDDAIEQAVDVNDQERLSQALGQLLEKIRAHGERVADEDLVDSDLILPDASATVDEVRDWLSEGNEGLIPGR